jgi:putative spermidine/putrescine transport system substrate-binding protein
MDRSSGTRAITPRRARLHNPPGVPMSAFRRTCLALCAGGLTLALSACGSLTSGDSGGSGGSAHTVTAYVGGDVNVQGLWQHTIIPGFQKANPGYHVKLVYSAHGTADAATLAKMEAAAKTGHSTGYDVIDSGIATDAASAGLLTKVSTSNVPNLKLVDKRLLGPVAGAAVPYRSSAVVLAYNSDVVKHPPTTYDALIAWIKAHPGRFAYNSPSTGGSGESFVQTTVDRHLDSATVATFQNGYDAAKEKEWNAGFAELRALNKDVYGKGVYPNGNQAVMDLLGKGQIDVAPVWSDMFLSSEQNGTLGKNIKTVQISQPSLTGGANYIAIPKSSTHQQAALKLANFILEPAEQAAMIKQVASYPVIPLSQLPASDRTVFAGADVRDLRPGYSGKSSSDLSDLWQQKVPGQ